MQEAVRTRVGLVGAGYVSAHHLRALKTIPSVEVVGITDLDFGRAQEIAARFGVSAAFHTLAEMASVRPDVIHVLTPPEFHCSVALEALAMGCHVFVEKPMALTARDCELMIATAREVGRVLSVNHSARMDPVVLRAAELVRGGAMGTIMGVDFFRSSDYPPYSGGPDIPAAYRSGSYPFHDLGIHGYSMFELFLGPIRRTDVRYASSGRDANLLFDEWRVLADCERGVGHMYLSWNVRPIRNEIIVQGTRGIIRVDCFLQTCSVVKMLPGPKFAGPVFSALKNSLATLWRVPINVLRFATGKLSGSPGIHISIQKFYEALERGTPSPISCDEGLRLIRLMEEACSAADQQKVCSRQAQLRPLPPARVLVTGASGFLGSRLVERLLQAGQSVRVFVRTPVPQWDSRVQVICGDLGDTELVDNAVAGVDTVYHLGAAMKGCGADFQRGTIWGTRNIIESSLRHNVGRVVYVSSLSVLDHAGHKPGAPVRENAVYEPLPDKRGLYTQTKLQAERMVLDAVRQRQLPAVILRPGQIFGHGAGSSVPSGAISLAGRWVVPGNGKLQLPLVYVEDVVDSLTLAAECDSLPGSIFNIVDTDAITQKEYIQAYQRGTPEKVRVWYVPAMFLYSLAWGCELLGKLLGRSVPLSRYRVRSLRPLAPIDVSAAVEKLGWNPRVGTKKGMKQMFEPKLSEVTESASVAAAH